MELRNENLGFEAKSTYETQNYEKDMTTQREWEAIRDECVSGGNLDDRCNIIAASNGTGRLEVVAKRLSCGCILILADSDGDVL